MRVMIHLFIYKQEISVLIIYEHIKRQKKEIFMIPFVIHQICRQKRSDLPEPDMNLLVKINHQTLVGHNFISQIL